MNFEPQTYEELIRMKRCVELTKYYEVTEEELWEIYHFLEQEPEAFIKGGRQNLSLIIGQNTATTQKVIMDRIQSVPSLHTILRLRQQRWFLFQQQ